MSKPFCALPLALAFTFSFSLSLANAADVKTDPAAADEAFRAAVSAKLKGDWDTACAKFEASLALDPSPSTLLNVVECLEHYGKFAKAWSEAHRAQVLNAETPGEKRRQELDSYATTLIERLHRKLAWVKVVLSDPPADIIIEKDGLSLPIALLDQPIPADPGTTRLVARANGYVPQELQLTLTEGGTTQAAIELMKRKEPMLDGATNPPQKEQPMLVKRPLWPWITGGAGIALMGVSIGFVVSQTNTQADIDKNCHSQPGGRCLAGYPYQEKNEGLYRDFGLFLGFGIAGVLATGASALGLVLAPRVEPAKRGAFVIVPYAEKGAAGAFAHGVF